MVATSTSILIKGRKKYDSKIIAERRKSERQSKNVNRTLLDSDSEDEFRNVADAEDEASCIAALSYTAFSGLASLN